MFVYVVYLVLCFDAVQWFVLALGQESRIKAMISVWYLSSTLSRPLLSSLMVEYFIGNGIFASACVFCASA
jgi:hypothetical protein